MRISMYILYLMVLGFLIQLFTGGVGGFFTSLMEFDPARALYEPWRFITPVFVHGGIVHLMFNALALFIFGPLVERVVRDREYVMLFLGGAFFASLVYYLTVLVGITPPVPAVGASGAIYAVLGAAAVIFPRMVIYVWFIPMEMRHAVVFWIITQTLGTFDVSSGVASAAHLGGLIFGLFFAHYLLSKNQHF